MLKNLLDGYITQRDILVYYNANISYKPLPAGINGLVFSYKGINNIIISKELSYYKRKKTLLHELAHIELNQLNRIDRLFETSIDKYEDEADRYIKFLLK